MARGAKPGQRFGGRQKGTPNKWTAAIRDAIVNAFERAGGEEYLVKVASKDPRTFCNLLSRVLPTTLEGGLDLRGLDLSKIDAARLPDGVLERVAAGDIQPLLVPGATAPEQPTVN